MFSAYAGLSSFALITCVAWQEDAPLLVGGDFPGGLLSPNVYGETLALMPPNLARLMADGTVDASFTPPDGLGAVIGMAVQPDGKVLVAESARATTVTLRRLLQTGAPDPDFRPALFDDFGRADPRRTLPLILQPDGKILVAWSFTAVNGVSRSSVARLNADGSVDASFDPGTGPAGGSGSGHDMDLARQPDGKILVAGDFNTFAGVPRRGVVRLHSNGSVDLSFDLGFPFGDYVRIKSIVVLHNGCLLVTAGEFDSSMSPYRLQGDAPIRLHVPQLVESGRQRLTFNSLIGSTYVLQASTNLVDWSDIATNTAADCWLQLTNSVAEAPALFFRVQRVPEP